MAGQFVVTTEGKIRPGDRRATQIGSEPIFLQADERGEAVIVHGHAPRDGAAGLGQFQFDPPPLFLAQGAVAHLVRFGAEVRPIGEEFLEIGSALRPREAQRSRPLGVEVLDPSQGEARRRECGGGGGGVAREPFMRPGRGGNLGGLQPEAEAETAVGREDWMKEPKTASFALRVVGRKASSPVTAKSKRPDWTPTTPRANRSWSVRSPSARPNLGW